jgi:hypothetical protein
MIPIGYMYKSVAERPDWLKAASIEDVYSVSNCVSPDFMEWINAWKHNGYWFFDDPQIIEELARTEGISLDGLTLFFYRMHEQEWDPDDDEWRKITPEKSFRTDVKLPAKPQREGFDVVTYTSGNAAECSPLSCNHYAEQFDTNRHCLLDTFDQAIEHIENGSFLDGEPGPYRVIEVCTVAPCA